MATPSSMILNSLISLGEKAIGDTLTSAEQTYYLDKLNAMMDSWSTERLMVYQILDENFPLVASTISYTIGSGGTFNTTRPTKITQAFTRDSSNNDWPVQIIDVESYNSLLLKTTSGTFPDYLYYDGADVAGLGTIYVYPAPSTGLTLHISSWKQLQQFASISDPLVLPNGYQRAIESNFAVEASPGGRDLPPALIQIARQSKAVIKSLNLPDSFMRLEAGVSNLRRGNIYTGP